MNTVYLPYLQREITFDIPVCFPGRRNIFKWAAHTRKNLLFYGANSFPSEKAIEIRNKFLLLGSVVSHLKILDPLYLSFFVGITSCHKDCYHNYSMVDTTM